MMISVITVTWNNLSTLKQTIDSVAAQTYSFKEHWIIDGGSTDGTLEFLQSISDKTEYKHVRWISEKDKGIFDAMNKGIERVAGDIFGFLNSDDFYAHTQVLNKIAKTFSEHAIDAVYGDLDYVHPVETNRIFRKWRSKDVGLSAFQWGWMPAHPTFYMRKECVKSYGGFRLDMGSAADYEFMLRYMYKHRIKTKHIPDVMVKMRTGGASNATIRGRLKANRMDRKAWTVNGLKPLPFTHFAKPARKIIQFILK
jgi:glycosyltransferase